MTDDKTDAEETFEGDERAGAYRVELPAFEGPLDLLLHLIKKHELDILDIPIGFISEKYVEYIKKMDMLSIDLAADYLVMAATLAHIKSKSLLPPDPNDAEDEELGEEEDPRAELIRRLLEYQKYKNAAEQLGGRSVLGRDVFLRGAANEAETGPPPLAQLSLFKLVDAFEGVLQRAKQVEDHQIDFERISVTERIGQISELLREKGRQRFEQLFDGDVSRADMIVTFLALLEMTKLRMTHLEQAGPLDPIFVELSVSDEDDEFGSDEALGSGALGEQGRGWDQAESTGREIGNEANALSLGSDDDPADDDPADDDLADDADSGESDEAPDESAAETDELRASGGSGEVGFSTESDSYDNGSSPDDEGLGDSGDDEPDNDELDNGARPAGSTGEPEADAEWPTSSGMGQRDTESAQDPERDES